MKLKVTEAEAKILILRALNMPADTELTIQKPRLGPFAPLRNMIEEIDRMAYTSHQKIQAIKRYRETAASGLAEAKWAVENWPVTKAWILKNRKAPTYYGNYPSFDLR